MRLGCEWRKRWAENFGDFFLKKKAVSWDLRLDEASWFLDLGEARPVGDYKMRCVLLGQMEQSAL